MEISPSRLTSEEAAPDSAAEEEMALEVDDYTK
jgi:hypothetical protein